MRRVIVAVAAFGAFACTTAPAPPPQVDPTGHGRARERWLFEQRAYPFGDIPADARRNAYAAVRRAERLSAESPWSAAAARTWRPIGPQPIGTRWPWKDATGRVKALAISPHNPNIVLAGSSSGGIWRSTDGGATFVPVSDSHVDLSIGAIAFAPSNPNIVYAASGSDFLGTGVLRSHDAGATWRVVSGPTFAPRGSANRIVVDAANPNRLWIAQTRKQDAGTGNVYSSGLLVSSDGGFSWQTLFRGVISDFAVAPGSASTFLLGIYRNDEGGAAGVYRTTNGGATWTLVFAGAGWFTFDFSRTAPGRAYLHSDLDGTARLHASDDGGASWKEIAAALPSDTPIFLAVHPTDSTRLYLGYPGGDLHMSVDGGAVWQNLTKSRDALGKFNPALSTAHIDQHALVFSPIDHRVLYLGNDGGVFMSSDGGTTFTSLAPTLSLVQAYGIAAHPLDPSILFLGTQDNGLARLRHNEWRELITGDYGSILFDRNDPSTLLTNYIYGSIYAFTANGDAYLGRRGTNAGFEESDSSPRIAFIAPLEQHELTNTLFFGTWRLFISNDFGRTWTAPAGKLDLTKGGRDTLSAIGLAPSDPNTIYTGSTQGRVMLSRDGGVSWTELRGLPDRSVRTIIVHPDDPARAWIGFSGYRIDHVHATANFGATWTSLSSGLPDVPVNALLFDPADHNVLYAGTDIGPFRIDTASGARWEFFGAGMPPVVVTSFDVTAAGEVVLATYGRGAYKLSSGNTKRRRGIRH